MTLLLVRITPLTAQLEARQSKVLKEHTEGWQSTSAP